jgi:hypothetical protein
LSDGCVSFTPGDGACAKTGFGTSKNINFDAGCSREH